MSEQLVVEFDEGTEPEAAAEFETWLGRTISEEFGESVRMRSSIPRYLSEDVAVDIAVGTLKILSEIYIAKKVLEEESEEKGDVYNIHNVDIKNFYIEEEDDE